MDKNNVLFVGNGIDLLNGYKTDYVSFLLSEKEQYKSLFIQGIQKKLSSVKIGNNFNSQESKIDIFNYFELLYINSEPGAFQKYLRTNNLFIKPNNDNSYIYAKLELNLDSIFFKVSEVTKTDFEQCPTSNIWLSYFITCYLDGVLSGNNWIDLEGLIYKNVKKINTMDSTEQLEYTIFDHKMLYYNDELDIYSDFLEMKKKLSKYIIVEKSVSKTKVELKCNELEKYGTRINFNYSYSRLLPVDDGSNMSPDEFFIHGLTIDAENIVFGYDDGMLTNVETYEYEYDNKEFYKMSKTYQLLQLSLIYQNEKRDSNIIIPKRDNIKYIGVLGHSISEADYNYFYTLCDFDKVVIEVFWYKYSITNTNGESENKDNQLALMENLISMIHEMERQTQKKILHRMLIEQRIIFRELKYKNVG